MSSILNLRRPTAYRMQFSVCTQLPPTFVCDTISDDACQPKCAILQLSSLTAYRMCFILLHNCHLPDDSDIDSDAIFLLVSVILNMRIHTACRISFIVWSQLSPTYRVW